MHHVNNDHQAAHETLMDEAARLKRVRDRAVACYGPTPAARAMAPVGVHQRAFWADADARRPVAMPPAPPTRQPLPPARPDVAVGLEMTGREIALALARVLARLRAALRLRIGDGVMPG